MNRTSNYILYTFSILLILWGCAGGTRGTGGLTIEGSVISTQGPAISNATITSLETGDSAVTDVNGAFVIETDPIVGTPSFLIESPTLQVTSTGGSIPEDAEIVTVQITINTSGTPAATQEVTTKKKRESNSSSSSSSRSSASSSSRSSNASSSSQNSSQGSSSSSSSEDDDDDDDQGSSSSSSRSDNSSSSSSSSEDDHENVEVEGPIQSLTSTTITVKNTTFTVNSGTDFDDRDSLSDFSVGELVEVRGKFQNGILIAKRIKLKN